MRILRFFLSAVIFLAVLSMFGFLVLRESLLYFATTQMKDIVKEMEKAELSGVDIRRECGTRGVRAEIKTIQTRFINDTEYQIEAICEYGSTEPVVIATDELPMWVTKASGQSGLIWDEGGISGLVLEIFGREATVILDGNELQITQGKQDFLGNKPQTQCRGYGYTCCDPITTIGQGEPITQALDCSVDCFQACQPRPVVLRFQSDPLADARTRVATVSRGGVVTFYYGIDPGKGNTFASGVIDFGDGQTAPLSEVNGSVTHTYQCAEASCTYTASISATDDSGNSSTITPVSSITIQVL